MPWNRQADVGPSCSPHRFGAGGQAAPCYAVRIQRDASSAEAFDPLAGLPSPQCPCPLLSARECSEAWRCLAKAKPAEPQAAQATGEDPQPISPGRHHPRQSMRPHRRRPFMDLARDTLVLADGLRSRSSLLSSRLPEVMALRRDINSDLACSPRCLANGPSDGRRLLSRSLMADGLRWMRLDCREEQSGKPTPEVTQGIPGQAGRG